MNKSTSWKTTDEEALVPEDWTDDKELVIPTGPPKSRKLNDQQRRCAKSWCDKRNPKAQVAQTASKEISDPAEITPEAVKATKDKITNEPL